MNVPRFTLKRLNSFRFKKLMALSGEGKFKAIGLIQGIWLFTHANCPRGDIGRFSNEDIALDLDIPLDEIDGLIAALVKAGWLDEHPEHRLVVHDWPVPQPRKTRHRRQAPVDQRRDAPQRRTPAINVSAMLSNAATLH